MEHFEKKLGRILDVESLNQPKHHIQTYRQTNIQTNRHTDIKICRQTDIHTDIQTYIYFSH